MIKLTSTEDVKEGMILGAPLVNQYGQILINSGAEIEERHLELLDKWGIRYLSILQEDAGGGETPVDENQVQEAEGRLGERMKWKPRNQFEEDLVQMAMKKMTQYQ
jgi:hypothetical protein